MTEEATTATAAASGAEAVTAVRAFLQKTYPALFGGAPVPLKVGIHKDIRERHPELARKALTSFLHWWVNTKAYLTANLSAEAKRYDLDGNEAGVVSAEGVASVAARLPKKAHLQAAIPRSMPEPFRTIMETATTGQPLDAEAHALLLAALENHPNRAEKIGTGVQAFIVVSQFPAFAVVRADGTSDTFSIKRCLRQRKANKARAAAPAAAATPVGEAA